MVILKLIFTSFTGGRSTELLVLSCSCVTFLTVTLQLSVVVKYNRKIMNFVFILCFYSGILLKILFYGSFYSVGVLHIHLLLLCIIIIFYSLVILVHLFIFR